MIHLIVCGDRNWDNGEYILFVLEQLQHHLGKFQIIEGEAQGADTFARNIGKAMALPIQPVPANWKRYGRAAGPIRNTEMLEAYNATGVIAFHDNIKASKGTKDMITQAAARSIPVWLSTDGIPALKEFIEGQKQHK